MPDAQGRAALEEAVRRVGTIALVHETLSHGLDETVPFDEVADVAMRAVAELTMSGPRVVVSRTGSFGQVRAEDATSLAMVVSELVHNAVEHGLAATSGSVTVNARRRQAKGGDTLVMTVIDDGVGLPGGVLPPGQGLGSQIVQSLVQDLRGKITWSPNSPSGTKVRLTAQLRRLDP